MPGRSPWCRVLVTLCLCALAAPTRAARAEDWPQFRGPSRDGTSKETGLLRKWPEGGPKVLWTVPVGQGYAGAAAGRIAAASIHQYLTGVVPAGESALKGIALRPMDNQERAAIFRTVEMFARVAMPELELARRRASFDEVQTGLPEADALREARRCLTCGCRKADCCDLRVLATAYDADPYRFTGARRRFSQDDSHPAIVYEPGKCIMCDACVRIAADAGEPLGLGIVGRGFEVSVAVPFGEPLPRGLGECAAECAVICPTGALALRMDSRRLSGICGPGTTYTGAAKHPIRHIDGAVWLKRETSV